jgi:hypothetical protein
MNHHFLGAAGLLFFALFITSCTDVPLSFSTNIPDARFVGYWQESEHSIYEIRKNSDGTATLIYYEYDAETKQFTPDSSTVLIYFTTIKAGKDAVQFMSIKMQHDDLTCYNSAKIAIAETGELQIASISTDFLKEKNNQRDSDIIAFGTPEKYQAFIRKNLGNPDLFDDTTASTRLPGLPKG